MSVRTRIDALFEATFPLAEIERLLFLARSQMRNALATDSDREFRKYRRFAERRWRQAEALLAPYGIELQFQGDKREPSSVCLWYQQRCYDSFEELAADPQTPRELSAAILRGSIREAANDWTEFVRLYREAARLWDEVVCDYLASNRKRRDAWNEAERLWQSADDLLPEGWDFAWNPALDLYHVQPGRYPVSIDGPEIEVDGEPQPSVTYHTLEEFAQDPRIPKTLAAAILRRSIPEAPMGESMVSDIARGIALMDEADHLMYAGNLTASDAVREQADAILQRYGISYDGDLDGFYYQGRYHPSLDDLAAKAPKDLGAAILRARIPPA